MIPTPADLQSQPSPKPAKPSSPWPARLGGGCLVLAGLLIGVPVGGVVWWRWSVAEAERLALEQQEKRANEQFDPVFERMKPADPEYDIDTTIRVVHELDLAMKERQTPEQLLARMARTDYADVAPEILEKRTKLLGILLELYAKQTRAEDQQAAFEFTSELLLSTMSVVSVSGSLDGTPHGAFSIDRQQAQELLADLKQKQEERGALLDDIDALEARLFEANLEYAETYYKYVDEWDGLCILRDRAYLAAREQDWDTVIATTDAAIARAPKEREAHLLGAMARIEKGGPEDLDAARRLLDGYVTDHPDATAPAFLLLGVLEEKAGNDGASRLHLQQAAAYYPKQAEALGDMLNPYEMRSYLRQSREGSLILEEYKSTMLGAGYFSPDLQLARAAFDAGDFGGGKQKVLDHFARRRAQGQWDYLLSDISFAHDLLGTSFREIFPEESFLDLEVAPTLMGGKLSVGVKNRSDRTLHNATLILCVHFTDMLGGDYEPFTAPATLPAVLAHESTDFGAMEIQADILGKMRSIPDIVSQRAILVTDEAILWVDTDDYKIAEAKEFRRAMGQEHPPVEATTEWHAEMEDKLAARAREVGLRSTVSVVSRYGSDGLSFTLPEELAVFRPNFRLEYGGVVIEPDESVIRDGKIVVTFAGVDDLDGADAAAKDAVLVLSSVFGEWRLTWSAAGTSFRYAGAGGG